MEKKVYLKPSVSVIEMENECSILAGSLGTSEGSADGTTPLSLDATGISSNCLLKCRGRDAPSSIILSS